MLCRRSGQLALQATLWLALQPEGTVRRVREIAAALGVTPTYMAKIVHSLTRVGLLRAVRGPGGGVKLGRPARDVRLWDVISAIEPLGDFEYCLLGLNRCSDVDPCPVHEHWKAMRQVLLEKLQTETLWDFASRMAGKGLVREQELTPAG